MTYCFKALYFLKFIFIVSVSAILFQSTCYAVGGPGIVALSENVDSDSDGVADSQDLFPFDPEEWFDTDKDGIGNNADPDDDNDTLPDTWETAYGLNPLLDDASADIDGDGADNLTEYTEGTDPTLPPFDSAELAQNSPPLQPAPIHPADESTHISLQPELQTHDFADPDYGDEHSKTLWQISTVSDFSTLVLDRETETSLTALPVSQVMLSRGVQYFWRVKVYDSFLAESVWSDTYTFTTHSDNSDDQDFNGVPDDQEINPEIDLDKNEIPDLEQGDLLGIGHPETDIQVSIKGFSNVSSIESAQFIDPGSLTDPLGEAGELPFGLIGFRLILDTPGYPATIKIYLSEPAPTGASWYKYDAFSGLVDYSSHVIFSTDRRSLVVELNDGGFGDEDGTPNGVIVDPSGIWMSSSQRETDGNPPVESNTGDPIVDNLISQGAAEGGGCFITAAAPPGPGLSGPWLVLSILSTIGMVLLLRRVYALIDSSKNYRAH